MPRSRVMGRATHWGMILVWWTAWWCMGCERSQPRRAPDPVVAASSAEPLQSAAPVAPGASETAIGSGRPAAGSGRPAALRTQPRASSGLLWTVKSKTATLHLLGSIHVGKQQLYPLGDRIEAAFARSDTLVLELYLEESRKLAVAGEMAAAASYPLNDSLDRHIGPALMAKLSRHAQHGPLPLPALKRFQPWFVSVTLTMAQLQQLGFDPEQGIDAYFQQRAEGKKRIISLETVEQQLAVFTGLSDQAQALMLQETLEETERLEQVMSEVVLAWQQGDEQKLEQLLMESMKKPEYKPVFQRLFIDRNVRMAKAVRDYLKTGSRYFVVVGAGHLVGKSGVVELLRATGLQVVRQ